MSKAKEDRQRRKKEQAKIAASKALVDAAHRQEDPMSSLQPFKSYTRNGLNVKLECTLALNLPSDVIDWAFNLTKKNMKMLYDHSDLKWRDREKREELTDEMAWYLLARNEEGYPVAFIHFRFDLDDNIEVLYCYEIQLEKDVRRKGLGKFMMQILELLAFQSQMKKVILTVFKHNHAAVNFFVNVLKYEIDESSPSLFDINCSYEILSKKIRTKTTKQPRPQCDN